MPFNRFDFILIWLCYSSKHEHALTHTRTPVNIEQDNFFKCLFEQDFWWFIANRKGEIVPIVFSNNSRAKRFKTIVIRVLLLSFLWHIQIKTPTRETKLFKHTKKATNNTKLSSFKRRGHHHRWPLTLFSSRVCPPH